MAGDPHWLIKVLLAAKAEYLSWSPEKRAAMDKEVGAAAAQQQGGKKPE